MVIEFFLHSLQRPCFPVDTQICTGPENLILSTGIRLGPGLLDLSGTSQVKFALFLFGTEGDSCPTNLFV